ncbi:MAG TPA: hypothetical protein VM141_04790 [Planctomycetota bacterium]|nr:hypothetical protein [Planctomycetota bacterium]
MYAQLLFFSCLVYLPLALGAAAKHHGVFKRDISQTVMACTWLGLEPAVMVAAFWSLDVQRVAEVSMAPLLGVAWMLSMYIPGALAARKLGLRRTQRGSFILAAMFSNNGVTLGASLCLVLFGVQGQAMALIFILGLMPLVLTLGFSIARRSAGWTPEERHARHNARMMGILRIVPYSAIALGLTLNFAGVPRPEFLPSLNRTLALADVALYSFAIGTLFVLSSVGKYLRECLVMSGLKFLVSPVLGVLLFFVASQFVQFSPELLKAIIVQCAMPVAIMSVVVSRFHGLDTDLAAACWVFTTLALAGVVPLLALVTRL